ncbi:hypothetical protein Aperf_G00000100289 [Anoplocephala perfoliata]
MAFHDVEPIIMTGDDSLMSPSLLQQMNTPDLGKCLLDAARNGDVEQVKYLLTNGALFTTDWLGHSALHFAAMNGHLTTCEVLLEAGFCKDIRTKVDRTPLHLAAQEGHADIVELLLKNGADIHAIDTIKMTALHWAVERGHCHVINVLMNYGANVNFQNKFELTPLELAEFRNNVEARDAMKMYDLSANYSVGRMAAPSEELADPTAFIITDEDTIVPAAPPADEVVITTVKEEPKEDVMVPEALIEEAVNDSLIGPNVVEDPDIKTDTSFDLEDFHLPMADSSTTNLSRQTSSPSDEELLEIETPDGKVLYVRQEAGDDGPNLIIFDRNGEVVDDENLFHEVSTALSSCQTVEGEVNTFSEDQSFFNIDYMPINEVNEILRQRILEFAEEQADDSPVLQIRDVPVMSTVEDIITWFSDLDVAVLDFTSFDQFFLSISRSGEPLLLRCSYNADMHLFTLER